MSSTSLIGREQALADLSKALDGTVRGHGGLVLLGGEAGVGKTRLATEMLNHGGTFTLRVSASSTTASAYGLLATALRAYRRTAPTGWPATLPMGAYLTVLLPELGAPPIGADRATVFEALREAFESIASRQPTVLFLDDLHLADHATLQALTALAPHLVDASLLVLAAYRSDELKRDHPVRQMRADLRRGGLLREITLEPLPADATAAMAGQLLGQPPTPALAALVHEHAGGLPFFVEELVTVLQAAGRLHATPAGVALVAEGGGMPVPETVRDLVQLRTAELSEAGRASLEVAAVAGMTVDLDVVAELTEGDDGLQDLFAEGLLVEVEPGIGRFRHALIREACYREIPWSRRRAVHRQVAERLERRGSPAAVLAQHWLAARELDRAREALIGAMDAACAAHAYRDAAEAAQQALEVWPEGQAEAVRTAVLDRLGQCAQLSGDLAEAARAWREVSDTYTAAGELRRVAEVQRHLAAVYELQGSWSRALAAREAAAAAFAATGLPGEAAAERLAAAAHLRVALRLTPALELVAVAAREADEAGRIDLRARALGLEGNILARLGQFDVGLGRVRAGLQLALEHNLGAAAADVYQRLSDALEHSGDLAAAKQSYVDAAAFCQAQGADGIAQVCMACLTAVLRQTGEWDRCVSICREVLDAPTSPHARGAVLGVLGAVLAQRGEAARARRVLLDAERHAAFIELVPAELLATWGLAMVEELDGALDRAVERCRTLLERWRRTEDRHYSIAGLRWAASFLASRQAHADVRACASALAHIVTETGTAEAVAALGHALGEVSLLEGNAAQAQEHFRQAINQLDALELPYEAAHSRVRGGVALVAAGDRAAGVELLADGYRRARNLGARPLAASAARELTTLGEPVERRLGRRAAGMLEGGGLTRREQAVLRLVAEGHTDREIARILVLSPRTVEMHVANVLGKFGCRSRAEAVRRGAELGLLGSTVKAT